MITYSIFQRAALLTLLMGLLPAAMQAQKGKYELIFSDEFDLPDGSAPDSTKWGPCPREGATWSRWISDAHEVAYIQDRALLCRAIPNPDRRRDRAPMLTGAMHSKDRFSFMYGKVEIRLKTNLHAGNFPAAWMMPQPPAKWWPYGGEVDIFESINTENRAYHTIHSHWTYHLGNQSNPQHGFNEEMSVAEWHVYGLEWTDSLFIWTVDGKETGRYPKAKNEEALENGQWPFDHPFYLILNQSVGDGSWAVKADTTYTYETYFDYVRVYQRTDSASQMERGSKTSRRRIWSWLPWNW